MKRLELCRFSGYGHYQIGILYYGKLITCITTNMSSIDDYQSDEQKRRNRGYKSLRSEIIRKYKDQR